MTEVGIKSTKSALDVSNKSLQSPHEKSVIFFCFNTCFYSHTQRNASHSSQAGVPALKLVEIGIVPISGGITR